MPHLHVQTRQTKYGSVGARGWFLFFHASSSIDVFIPCQVEYSYKGPLQIPLSTAESTFKLEIQPEEPIIHHKTPPSYKLACSPWTVNLNIHRPLISYLSEQNVEEIVRHLATSLFVKTHILGHTLPASFSSRPLFTSSCSLADKSMKNFTTQKRLWIYQDILNQPWGDHVYNEGLKQMRYFRVSEHGKYQHVPV